MSNRFEPKSAVVRLNDAYARHGDKLRFLFVGAMNTAASYALFLILLATMGPLLQSLATSEVAALETTGDNYYLVVQWVAWVLSVPVSVTSMKYLVFRSKGRWLPEVGRAYLVYLPTQAVSNVLLWLAVSVIGLVPAVGQLLTILVTTVVSYFGHKHFTFGPSARSAGGSPAVGAADEQPKPSEIDGTEERR